MLDAAGLDVESLPVSRNASADGHLTGVERFADARDAAEGLQHQNP